MDLFLVWPADVNLYLILSWNHPVLSNEGKALRAFVGVRTHARQKTYRKTGTIPAK